MLWDPNRRKLLQTSPALGSMLLPVAGWAEDWPQFRGPNRDNVWNETGILQTFPAEGLKIRWRKPVGTGWSSPVVAEGRVFLTDAQLQKPSVKERVHCFEEATGQQVWQTNTVTDLKNGASIHLTPNGGAVFLFTDKGDLIRARLTPQGYHEFSRARLLEPTFPFGDRKCAWTPPAYANRHVFARNDEELVCASLAAKP